MRHRWAMAASIFSLVLAPAFSMATSPNSDYSPPSPSEVLPVKTNSDQPNPFQIENDQEQPADYAARLLALRARRAGELASTAEALSYQFIANPSLNLTLTYYGQADERYDVHPWNKAFSDYLEGMHSALPELDDAVFFDIDEADRIPLTMTDSLTRDVRKPIRDAIMTTASAASGKAVWDVAAIPFRGSGEGASPAPVLLCARLVKNLADGRPIGVLTLILNPDRMARTVTGSVWDESAEQEPKADFTVLVDSRGIVLGGPTASMIGRAAAGIVPGMDKIAEMMAKELTSGSRELLKDGRHLIIVFSKVPERAWTLISVLPQTENTRLASLFIVIVIAASMAFLGLSPRVRVKRKAGISSTGLKMVESLSENPQPEDIPPWFESLSPRERRILLLLASGKSNKEIAFLLALQEQTIKNYLHSIYSRIGVQDRVSATLLVERAGIKPRP